MCLQCSECPFSTPQRSNLVRHLASRHRKDETGKDLKADFKCDSCDFSCVSEHQLKAHRLRKHTARSDMRHRCSYCDYASVEKASLEKHVRFRHTKERPYMCNVCGFSTHTLSSLSRHRRGHTADKPYECGECGQRYADKKRLREHHLGRHAGAEPQFHCTKCQFKCRRCVCQGPH